MYGSLARPFSYGSSATDSVPQGTNGWTWGSVDCGWIETSSWIRK